MAELVVVGVHQQERIDVVALALGLGAHCLGLLDRGETGCEVGLRDSIMRIIEEGQRDAPLGHGAGRVGLQNLLEDVLSGEVPIRVLIAHGPVEAALRRVVARGLEVNAAELLVDVALRHSALSECPSQECQTGCQHAECAPHGGLLSCLRYLRIWELCTPMTATATAIGSRN